jgi:hypothetical protein
VRYGETDQLFAKQRSANRHLSSELPRSVPRKFKNLIGADRNLFQLAQINEPFIWNKSFFDSDEPPSDLIKHEIVKSAVRLPGDEPMSGIVTQKRRTSQMQRNRV